MALVNLIHDKWVCGLLCLNTCWASLILLILLSWNLKICFIFRKQILWMKWIILGKENLKTLKSWTNDILSIFNVIFRCVYEFNGAMWCLRQPLTTLMPLSDIISLINQLLVNRITEFKIRPKSCLFKLATWTAVKSH